MIMHDESHSDLVLRARAGDRDAFYELVKVYQTRIWRQCMRLARNAETADELTQQVFLKAYDKLKTFRGEAPFGAWISMIALNVGRDHARVSKRWKTVELDEGGSELSVEPEISETILGNQKDRAVLQDAVEQLPDKQRQVLLLRIYEDFSFKEIADALGGTEGAAKVNFHYALKSLKTILARLGITQFPGRTR